MKVYMTWHTKELPPLMATNFDDLKTQNPELEFVLFDDEDCLTFIKENFPEDVANAYQKLIPKAYRSDLWRYCILFKNGGIYLDMSFKSFDGFKLANLTDKEYFAVNTKGEIMGGLIVSKPGNPILSKCIDKVVENCKTEYYGESSLELTGPRLLSSFFSEEDKKTMEIKFLSTTRFAGFTLRNRFILVRYDNYREEQRKFQKTPYYDELWHEKKCFNI
jgi:mannosyltransferase OCH1-like enzyme